MKDGIIEQVGSPEEIYGKPKTKFVAEFIGNVNFIKGKIVKLEGDKAIVKVLDNEFKVDYSGEKKESDEVDIVLRPEAIELCKSGILEGVVVSSTFMGSYQDYVVDVNGDLINIEVTNPKEKEQFEEGDKVKLNFNLDTLHIV
ncbi:TOBE domain-containing protein [Clostridium chrysemydis]|uniref:TOBE domain-containing protein n=1 Tax=Clostridium chrysemydis TaxID=2665504 RepID=UPI001EE5349A|nr:TOBE domain-containing protein [Clostridium chrysemydis]